MKQTQKSSENVATLKGYIQRLSAGEALSDVRQDFVKEFRTVDAADIARAEQELIQSGTPVAEVQRLCDVHAALFHGHTVSEQIAQAEAAVHASLAQSLPPVSDLVDHPGHPVAVFQAENRLFQERLHALREALDAESESSVLLELAEALRPIIDHYARKGDLIYPVLNHDYGFSGPANVMWGVDNEIRDTLNGQLRAGDTPELREQLDMVVTRASEMIAKESNILFPLCLRNFTEEDWMRVYYEQFSYPTLLAEGYPKWPEAEARRAELYANPSSSVAELSIEQLQSILNTIPLEITFIDDQDINRFFNDGAKIFKRPATALGRPFYTCHPAKVQPMVRQIIQSFRAGVQDSVDVWMKKNGKPVLVRYMAVRNGEGKYVGTMEIVQEMGFAVEHFAE